MTARDEQVPRRDNIPFMQPEELSMLQELAVACSGSLSVVESFRLVLDSLGRRYGCTAARVVGADEAVLDGYSTIEWPFQLTTGGQAEAVPLWNDHFGDEILRSGESVMVGDLSAAPALDTLPQPSVVQGGYVAVPIRSDGRAVAVMEFVTELPIDERSSFLSVLHHAATLMGLVIDRGQTQRRLRESERRFRGIFDESYQFIGLLRPDGMVLDINKTALDFAGVEAREIIGEKIWRTSWWSHDPFVVSKLRSAVRQAGRGEFVGFESTVQGSEGHKAVVDVSIKPIRNRRGQVNGLIFEARDITRLHSVLDHLRMVEKRLEDAQRIAHIGHWEYNIRDEQAVFSDTLMEIFGLDRVRVIPTSEEFIKRIHPDDIGTLQKLFSRSYETGEPFEAHIRIIRPDGATRMVYIAGRAIRSAEGEMQRMAGIVQDISGRLQLEESLAHSINRLSGLLEMGQAVSSTLDLGAIHQTVLSTGRKLLDADAVSLFTHEGRELRITAVNQTVEAELLGKRIPDNNGIAGNTWTTGETIWLHGDQCRQRRSPQLVNAAGFNANSIIAVPVRWQDTMLGVLEAADQDDNAFDANDVELLQAIANWTSIAISNAGQHRSLERRLQESEAIAKISRALSETLEPQDILTMIVNAAHELVPRSDWAIIHLSRGRPERLVPAAVAGTDVDMSDYIIGPDEGLAGLALHTGKLYNVGDTRLDERASEYAHTTGLHSLLVSPIQTRNRRLGTISLHCVQTDAFTEEDERLLTILSAQAGLAIENSYLFDSQRRARQVAEMQRERLRVLAERVVNAQEEERLRISRELHDEAGQALTSLKISLDLIRGGLPQGLETLRDRLADLAGLTGSTMETLRTLAHDLRPPGLDSFGLNVALEGLCHDFSGRTGLTVTYTGCNLPDLPMSIALSLYRFAQEALTNTAKHAEASVVKVILSYDDEFIHLAISDDGKGFDVEAAHQQSNGIGLVSLQERIDLIGGTLDIDSAPGKGVRLVVHVPFEEHIAEI